MPYLKKFLAFSLFVLFGQVTLAQDIISKDGYNMGPRKYFIATCAGDSLVELNPYQGYSSIEFCHCMAENLLPLLTRKEMDYYLAGDRQKELLSNREYAKIMADCMVTAQEKWVKPTPPQEEITIIERSSNDSVIISKILEMVDYESKFYEILDEQLLTHGNSENIQKDVLETIRKKVKYDVINQPVIINTYKEYSSDDLEAIYEYFEPMTSQELTSTGVRYEQHILDYFERKITIMIEEELNYVDTPKFKTVSLDN